ncbi:hypothetical protein [Pseudomonas multiresinivorans]|uniref:Sel1 repeat family protein n=1 Tax=Pseudomonas multiresinivorans TaxID=95301 RepID=A0A7Z3BLC3_9PSED|nr:hypothetical protein [Pseudomonas multiresinivorans]QJP09040.1 hypothetical protein G4G71_14570 [Pseudomonas multiresinivorans]
MALETGHKVQIAIAVLGLVGTLTVAGIANWERIFPPPPPPPPPSVELGLQYLAEERFEEAVAMLKPFARNGDARAQYSVGRIYDMEFIESGDPTGDKFRASYWYKKAAAQNYKDSQSSYEMVEESLHDISSLDAVRRFSIEEKESGHQAGL